MCKKKGYVHGVIRVQMKIAIHKTFKLIHLDIKIMHYYVNSFIFVPSILIKLSINLSLLLKVDPLTVGWCHDGVFEGFADTKQWIQF